MRTSGSPGAQAGRSGPPLTLEITSAASSAGSNFGTSLSAPTVPAIDCLTLPLSEVCRQT